MAGSIYRGLSPPIDQTNPKKTSGRLMRRTSAIWLTIGAIGFCLLPWHMNDDGFWSSRTFTEPFTADSASGLILSLVHGRWWLLPGFVIALAILPIILFVQNPVLRARVAAGLAGLALFATAFQGLAITGRGPRIFENLLGHGPALEGQAGLGIGGGLFALALLLVMTTGIAQAGKGRGDAFIVGLIGLIIALVTIFVFYPVLHILVQAFQDTEGGYTLSVFTNGFFSSKIWGLSCLGGGGGCGVAINSIFLGIMTGVGTTVVGLAFALVFTRTDFPAKKLLRALTVLPIITPPFVIGLALILLFGRTGTVTEFAADLLGLEASRWLYGFWGIYFAQMLSFTPIAFLVLIGVVEGVSTSMEEASQTLNADRWQTFRHVSLPLMRPGLANAFLLGFIESLADFGNPLVLGGNYNVLSTEIFFAIVGSVADPAKAAILAVTLLMLSLGAFIAQRAWLGRKSYATVTGKADSGRHAGLSPLVKWISYGITLPWATLTVIVYSDRHRLLDDHLRQLREALGL